MGVPAPHHPNRQPSHAPRAEQDRAEFEAVYRAEANHLRAWLRRQTGDAGDDLAAETFVRAFGGWQTYRGDGSRRSWLWQIARNILANWRRDRARHPTDPDDAPPAGPDEPADAVVDQRAAVWELLSLVDGQTARTAVYLRYVEGRSADEVADALGMSRTAVTSLTHRALKRLRDHLEGHA